MQHRQTRRGNIALLVACMIPSDEERQLVGFGVARYVEVDQQYIFMFENMSALPRPHCPSTVCVCCLTGSLGHSMPALLRRGSTLTYTTQRMPARISARYTWHLSPAWKFNAGDLNGFSLGCGGLKECSFGGVAASGLRRSQVETSIHVLETERSCLHV